MYVCVCINNDRSMRWPTKNSDLTPRTVKQCHTSFSGSLSCQSWWMFPPYGKCSMKTLFFCGKKTKDLASTFNFSLSKQNQSAVEPCLLVELWWFSILRWFKNHTAHFGIINGNHDPRNRCAGRASVYSVTVTPYFPLDVSFNMNYSHGLFCNHGFIYLI